MVIGLVPATAITAFAASTPEESGSAVYTIYVNDGVNSTDLNLSLTNLSCDGTIEKVQDPETKLWTVKITFPHTEECSGNHKFTVYCTAECCCIEMVPLEDGKTYACENAATEPDPNANVVAWNDTDTDGEIDEDETTYTTLSDALKAGGAVKMYKDYDVGEEGEIDLRSVTVTLDLNGKNITWEEAGDEIFSIESGCELTIKGNGNIISTMNSAMGPSAAIAVSDGKLILDGGTISSPYYAIEMHSGEMVVNDGTISTDGLAIQNGTCTINGGTITDLYNNNSICTINGGTFHNSFYNYGNLTIKGGKFRNNPTEWVAEGYESKYNDETWYYDVTPKAYTVDFDEIENGSVTSAVNEAFYGEIVTLIVTPAAHYRFESILITDQNGNSVALDENNSFAMPIGGVTVSATFKAIDYATQTDFADSIEKLNKAITDLDTAMKQSDADLSEEIEDLIEALNSAKATLEATDVTNKSELTTKIDEADAVLQTAINALESVLDNIKQTLESKDTELEAKDKKLEAKDAELEAKDAELEAKDKKLEAKDAELEAKDKKLEAKDADLEAKDSELQTFIIIVCVISGVAFCGCGTLAAFYIIDKKKISNK